MKKNQFFRVMMAIAFMLAVNFSAIAQTRTLERQPARTPATQPAATVTNTTPTVQPMTNTALGRGIDITKAATVSSKYIYFNRPIIDVDKLNAEKRIVQNSGLGKTQETTISVANTVKEMSENFSSKNKVSYKGAFSVDVAANYSQAKSSKTESKVAKYNVQIVMMREYINAPDAKNLSNYWTAQFKTDVSTKTATQLLDTYGSHMIARCNWGGVIEAYYTYVGSTITSDSEIEATIKGSFAGLSASSINKSEKKYKNFSENTYFKFIKDGGGNIDAGTDLGKFVDQLNNWMKGLATNNMAACGLDGVFDETNAMIPLWKIIAPVNPTKANEVQKAFETRLAASQTVINGFPTGQGIINGFSVLRFHLKNSGDEKQYQAFLNSGNSTFPYTVLNDLTNRANGPDIFTPEVVWNKNNDPFLDADKDASESKIFTVYSKMITDKAEMGYTEILAAKAGDALKHIPAGFVKIATVSYNQCGGCDDIFLYGKKAKKGDWVIDHVGGISGRSVSTSLPPSTNPNEQWKWVEMVYKSGLTKGEPGDLNNDACKTKVHLIMHRIKLPN